jgi:DNA modification methylase
LRDYGCDGQIGLEPTPEAYVADLVEVFREVKRVLRNDGTLWLNLGDSYAGSWGDYVAPDSTKYQGQSETRWRRPGYEDGDYHGKPPTATIPAGLKKKDLCMIPAQVAIALRSDGWYLRSDIIWNKPNPMPESVTDRCTKSHEDIFMLTKSERYYYDAEAIKEPTITQDLTVRDRETTRLNNVPGRAHMGGLTTNNFEMRNKRDVWTVATQPCAEAHFATFPPKLIEPMILAGTSEKGCCPKCGKPWERIVEHENAVIELSRTALLKRSIGLATQSGGKQVSPASNKTIGWQPTCNCGLDPVPCTILDPFMGSGTVAIQCVRLHRHYLGCELNPEYVRMAERRIADMVGPLFAGESDGSQT